MFYRSSLPFLEVNIMWAGHQTHHSSEDYNLTTALRQSMFHRYISWVK
jgi:alkylglycerol monooxygenase